MSVTGRRQSGFTMLEVLLAFVIFALSFATVLEIIGGSVRSTVRARDYSEAALTAQSIMELVGTEIPIIPGGYEGETDAGFRWTVDIFDYQPADEDVRVMEVAQMEGTLLYWVDLQLQWGDGVRSREARFTTLRGIREGTYE